MCTGIHFGIHVYIVDTASTAHTVFIVYTLQTASCMHACVYCYEGGALLEYMALRASEQFFDGWLTGWIVDTP